jgi:tripartite-type tricarboxylate transporter receptor subunit TctC
MPATLPRRRAAAAIAAFLTGAAVLHAPALHAQEFPAKPVRLLVGFPPGGTLDIVGRLLAQKLGEVWKQPVIVENRPGASGNIAVDAIAKSAPDGYTIGIVATPVVTSPHLQKLPYDITKDLAAVTQTAILDYVLVINPQLPAKNLREFVDLVKREPGKHTYGSAGNGSGQHLYMELLKAVTKAELTHVPYKGSAPSLQAVMVGEVSAAFDVAISATPFVRAGKVRGVAVSGSQPNDSVPGATPLASVYPEFSIEGWHGILAAGGTPRAVLDKLAKDIGDVVFSPEVSARFREVGLQPRRNTPAEFERIIRTDLERWGKVIRENNIRAD